MLSLRNVSKHYRDGNQRISVLRDINLSVLPGETIALMGESGSGKSTLLHLSAGFVAADSGKILVGKDDLSELSDTALSRFRRHHLGVVFQQYNLLPSINVIDNIRFVRRINGMADDPDFLEPVLGLLKLYPLLNKWPEQLSGGEQQRVAIARAIAHRPGLLLADEPTGNLDEGNSHKVMALLQQLVKEHQMTLLLATHSAVVASYLSRTVRLHKGRLEHG